MSLRRGGRAGESGGEARFGNLVDDQLLKESEKQLVETEEGRADERSWRRHEEEDGESWEEEKGRRGEGWGGGDRPLWWERREEEAALD